MSDTESDDEYYDNRSDSESMLCDTCRYLRIPQFFVSPRRNIPHDTLEQILSKQASCTFCRLIGHAIHVSACAACNRAPPLPADLAQFNPREMFPKMTRPPGMHAYIDNLDSRWIARAAHLRDRDGKDVAEALREGTLDGRPAGMITRIFVELNLREALEGEIHLLAADAARLRLAPAFHNVVVGERVDIAWIRCVLTACANHPKCQGPKQSRFPVDVRVIDTVERAVVPLDARVGYIALSYTWGGDQQFKLLLENIAQWSQPGGMPPLDQLPPTIRDSIILCRLLNRRYLWIDSLCITQNDASRLRGQLEQMDLIYQCAEFTIVAAAGLGANAGLPGIDTTPRAPQQLVETVHGLRFAVPLPSLAEAAKHSFWKTRAWTFQEQMLSSKVLVFTSRQVYYECASEIYTEDNLPGAGYDDEVVLRTDVDAQDGLERMAAPGISAGAFAAEQDTPFNSFLMYQTAVANYTARNVGNPTDILNAFIGVANAFQRFSGMRGFVGGLSVMGLSDALVWRPGPATRLVRRTAVNPVTGRLFPTWTWTGYVGPIEVERVSDPHALGLVVSEWAAVYRATGSLREVVYVLPSVEIDAFTDTEFFSATPSPWELLHAYMLRLRTEICCSLGVVVRNAQWAERCAWDCAEGSEPHGVCLLNAEGVCVGSAWLDNSATSIDEGEIILVAVSKGWHPKTNYFPHLEYTMRQTEGEIPTINILLGKKVATGVERIGVGRVVTAEWSSIATLDTVFLI